MLYRIKILGQDCAVILALFLVVFVTQSIREPDRMDVQKTLDTPITSLQ